MPAIEDIRLGSMTEINRMKNGKKSEKTAERTRLAVDY